MGFRLFLVNLLFALAIHETEGTVTTTLEDQVTDMSKALNDFVNTNLGVDQLQDHLSKITSKTKTQEGSEILRKFHDSLEEKVRKANQTLEELIDVIKNDFKGPGDGDDKPITSCCDYDARKTTYSNLFKNWVNFDDVCGYASVDHNLCPNQLRTLEDKVHRLTQSVMLEKMKEAYNKHGKGSSRHIYLGTTDGYFLGYPADRPPEQETMCNCSAFDPRYRPWYPNLVNTKEGKEFVIVLDYSSKMKGDLLKQAKNVVHNLLRIIDGKDKIVLRIISGGNSIAPSEFDCLKFLTEAHPSVIKVLKDFVDRTGQTGLLEYAKVFRDSFRLFGSSNKKKLFILITSGEHDESYSQVKEYYKEGYQTDCQASVVIFLVQGPSTPLITRQEHEGLKQEGCDACNDQNCDSFNKFQLVDIYPRYNEADIRQQVAKIYKAFQNELGPPQLQFSMPYEDFYGLGTMIDACTRVVSDDNKLLGVLCLSFLSNELFGVTAEVANTKDAYPFLIDKSGTTYIHPYYINPELHASGSRIDITNFETSIQFQNQVYNSMKSGGEDEKSFNVQSSVPLGTLGAKFESKNFTYIWREVEGSSFSVGVAVSSVYKDDLQLQSLTTKGNELYHRLSLQDGIQDELCSHYGYIAIKDQPVVSIAPDSFEQPSVYYEKESKETVKTLQNYFNETYVENPTAFKSNTIRNEIRQAVMATNLMNKIWTGDESNQRLIIKWRYIGMENGVFRIFPGIEIPEFDPRQQQWYHLAETFPGKLVFTTPYKDSNDPSQASILSLSKQITEELSGVKQGSGVIGMDFEFRYFQFLIERDLTLCAGKVIRGTCSIINTDGFLLYHNGTDGDLYKHIHLVEKEPNVARKLLQSGIMKKTSCIEYNDRLPRTIWFYSLDDVTVSQSDNGTFWLVPIKGTNLLLLFTKHSNVEKEQEECECSKPSLKGEVLGKCREGVDEASCDCPCYVEKACLSDLFETDAQRQSTLICQPRSMGQKMPDSTHLKNLMKDKMPLDECYPLNCSHFQRSDECNLYGCFWNAQQCSDVQRPTTTKNPTTDEQGGDSDDNTTIIIIVVVVVVVVVLIILIVIIACVVKRRKRQGKPSQDHHLKPPLPPHPPTYSETIVNRYEEEFHA